MVIPRRFTYMSMKCPNCEGYTWRILGTTEAKLITKAIIDATFMKCTECGYVDTVNTEARI